MISVLCPTRGRQETFGRSISVLRHLADGPIEVLAYVDNDDVLPDIGVTDAIVQGPRVGYSGMHVMVNALAREAGGEWLLLWNDDAVMCTPHWTAEAEGHRPAVLNPATNHGHGLVPFPLVPRSWVDELGHFSLNRHCDSWWQEIGCRLGVLDDIAVEVHHDRADLTGGNDDATFAHRSYDSTFYGPENMALIEADVAVVARLL